MLLLLLLLLVFVFDYAITVCSVVGLLTGSYIDLLWECVGSLAFVPLRSLLLLPMAGINVTPFIHPCTPPDLQQPLRVLYLSPLQLLCTPRLSLLC